MNNKLPEYLIKKNNLVHFLLFTMIFSLFFINIYKPFKSNNWLETINDLYNQDFRESVYFLLSTIFVLVGILLLTGSRVILYFFSKKKDLMYLDYIIWIFFEISCLAIFYSLAIYFITRKQDKDFFDIFPDALLYTALILFIPYTVSWLYLALKERDRVIDKIVKNKNIINKNAINNTPITEDNEDFRIVKLTDEKGDLKLAINMDNLFYIESADNYIDIYYIDKAKITHFLLRNSLKNIETQFTNTPLIRCHRSYIVNFEKVKILRKEKDGISLNLDYENIPDIPVSKTYTEKIINLFSNN